MGMRITNTFPHILSGKIFCLGAQAEGLTTDIYRICTEQRNKFSVGETIEVMKPDGTSPEAKVLAIYDEEGNPMESAPHPQQKLYVQLTVEAEPLDVLRRKD